MKKIMVLLVTSIIMVSTVACGAKNTSTVQVVSVTEEARKAYIEEQYRGTSVEPAESFAGGDGTAEHPFEISNAQELALLSYYLDPNTVVSKDDPLKNANIRKSNFVLTEDIVINDISDYDNWLTNPPTYGWTGIASFDGHFDGQGHKIIGMYAVPIEKTSGGSVTLGLIGNSYDGVIENIVLEKAFLIGYAHETGSILGGGSGCIIRNCEVEAKIYTGGTDCGGILGNNSECIVDNCLFKGMINDIPNQQDDMSWASCYSVGGIVGSSYGGAINDCEVSAVINTPKSSAGGVCGSLDAALLVVTMSDGKNRRDRYADTYELLTSKYKIGVENSTFEGTLVGGTGAGGIAGTMASSLLGEAADRKVGIYNCVNMGTISTSGMALAGAGGICGYISNENKQKEDGNYNMTFEFQNCENNGVVELVAGSSSESAGGIVGIGSLQGGTISITSCVNNANISTDSTSGGIIGNLYLLGIGSLIMNELENNGAISGDKYAGGIGGNVTCAPLKDNDDAYLQLKKCYNYGQVEGEGTKGGLFGAFMPGILEDTPIGSYDVEDCGSIGDLEYFGLTDSIEVLKRKMNEAISETELWE